MPNEGLGNLCALFGVTRQAYYESMEHFKKTSIAHMIVITMIRETRDEMPLLGTRRAYFLLKPEFIGYYVLNCASHFGLIVPAITVQMMPL